MKHVPQSRDITHAEHFRETADRVLEIYEIKDKFYGGSWINDPLDARALLAEITAKFARIKNLVWDGWDTIDNHEQRSRAVETIDDSILYLMMLSRRLQLEKGEVSSQRLAEMRDES